MSELEMAHGFATWSCGFCGARGMRSQAEMDAHWAAHGNAPYEREEDLRQQLCGAAFVQGQLLGMLERIQLAGETCHFDRPASLGCECGLHVAAMAADACELLEPPPWRTP